MYSFTLFIFICISFLLLKVVLIVPFRRSRAVIQWGHFSITLNHAPTMVMPSTPGGSFKLLHASMMMKNKTKLDIFVAISAVMFFLWFLSDINKSYYVEIFIQPMSHLEASALCDFHDMCSVTVFGCFDSIFGCFVALFGGIFNRVLHIEKYICCSLNRYRNTLNDFSSQPTHLIIISSKVLYISSCSSLDFRWWGDA